MVRVCTLGRTEDATKVLMNETASTGLVSTHGLMVVAMRACGTMAASMEKETMWLSKAILLVAECGLRENAKSGSDLK